MKVNIEITLTLIEDNMRKHLKILDSRYFAGVNRQRFDILTIESCMTEPWCISP
jgi:hypothetical protein